MSAKKNAVKLFGLITITGLSMLIHNAIKSDRNDTFLAASAIMALAGFVLAVSTDMWCCLDNPSEAPSSDDECRFLIANSRVTTGLSALSAASLGTLVSGIVYDSPDLIMAGSILFSIGVIASGISAHVDKESVRNLGRSLMGCLNARSEQHLSLLPTSTLETPPRNNVYPRIWPVPCT